MPFAKQSLSGFRELFSGQGSHGESCNLIRQLLDSLPTPVWLADLAGNLVAGNRAACLHYGYAADQWSALSAEQLFCHGQPDKCQQLRKGLATDHYYFLESDHRDQQGRLFPGEAQFQVLQTEGGSYCLVSAKDNTDLHRATVAFHDSRERFRTLFEQTTTAAAILLPEGFFQQFNHAFSEQLGLNRETIMTMNVRDLVEAQDRPRFDVLFAEAATGQSGQLKFRRGDGRTLWAEVSLNWVRPAQGQSIYCLLLMQDVTAQKQAEQALRESEEKYRWVVEHVRDAIIQLDGEGRLRFANPAWEKLTGCTTEGSLGRPFISFVDPGHLIDMRRVTRQILQGQRLENRSEFLCRQPDGSERWLEIRLQQLQDKSGEISVAAELHDVTEHKVAAENLERERSFLQTVLDGVPDPLLVIDLDRRIKMTNHAARQPLVKAGGRQTRHDYCYCFNYGLRSPCADDSRPCPLEEVLQSRQPVSVMHWIQGADGGQKIFQLQLAPLFDRDGCVSSVLETRRDVTSLFEAEAQLREKDQRLHFLVEYDPQTRLPNRGHLAKCLEEGLARSRRNNSMLAILQIGLDRFNQINESLGRSLGDQLLGRFAQRMTQLLRESDLIARLSGDEFVVMLEGMQEIDHIARVAEKLHQGIGARLDINGIQLYQTASIGISVFPHDGNDGETLLKAAASALGRAKDLGRNTVRFYTPDMNARSCELLLLQHELHEALQNQQLVLHYQPQIDLVSGQLKGVEALVRWQHPTRGLVPPGDFIPLAEDSGLIVPLGEWVLKEACRQNVRWLQDGFAPIRMTVNISARQFHQTDLVTVILATLMETGLPPQYLELEFTESMIMRDVNAAIATMQQLVKYGVRLAIDDFGTGYSSLAHLKRFPLANLKIDRSFVRDVTSNREDEAIVGSIIALAHNLDLQVVAEGVETDAQFALLKQSGCELGQGFLFSKPLPAAELVGFFRPAQPWSGYRKKSTKSP